MKNLLIIEDDETYAAGLVRTFSRRGYSCLIANNCNDALALATKRKPDHILMDLNLGNETTQPLIPQIKKLLPLSHLVILTGFGTIPSTVQAIKDGAQQYLCKPATPENIEKAFEESKHKNPTPLWDMEQEHILKTLEECGGNISQTAKNLGLHRRTLQRRLKKI